MNCPPCQIDRRCRLRISPMQPTQSCGGIGNWWSRRDLAAVLGTTADKVTDLAESMGLPREVSVPSEMRERGYITLVRRNWHLLPYDQLLQLLDMTAEELAFRLREDDFLYHKLGALKPRCEPVTYREPDDESRRRAAEIRALVLEQFGELLTEPAEPRFGFIDDFTHASDPPVAAVETNADEPLRFIYSYFAVFGDPLANPQLDPFPDGLLARLRAQGVNGIWLHTVLRQLAPGGEMFPEFGEGHERAPAEFAESRRSRQTAWHRCLSLRQRAARNAA